MSRFLAILAMLALLSSCAKPPLQKLDAAEYMLKRAQLMHAGEFAPTEYQAAHTALNDARRAIEKTDYREADDSLDFSLQHSRRAVKLAAEGKARRIAEEAARRKAEEQARQEAIKAEEAKKRAAASPKKIIVKKTPKLNQRSYP